MNSVKNGLDGLGDQKDGNITSSLFEKLPENKQCEEAHLRGKLTRGCRFQDLNEAHRNITGRNIPNSCSDSLSQSCSNSSESQDRASSNAESVDVGSVAYSDEVASHDIFDSSWSLVSDDREADLGCGPDGTPTSGLHGNSSDDVSLGQPETPDSMVERIYKLYQSHMDLSPTEDDKVETSTREYQERLSLHTPQAVPDREGATTRLGFHTYDTGRSISANTKGDCFSSEPKIVEDHGDPGDEYQPRDLASAHRENMLFPMPLRVQSIRGDNSPTSYKSGAIVSADGMTEDSDDDPFRYDKNPYKIFLQPSKEREVSAALKHIGSLDSHSRATLYSKDDGTTPAACQISLRPPPIPKEYREKHSRPESTLDGQCDRALTPEDADEFYDTSIIQPNWEVERGTYEVRVISKDEDSPQLPGRHNLKSVSDVPEGGRKGKHPPKTKTAVRTDVLYDAGRENTTGERDEWETVVTSAAGFGSVGQSSGLVAAVGPRLSANFHDFKITGSSLADVSDGSSFEDIPFDEYASTDRIVQPSSGQDEQSEESLRIHDLNGAKIPVIVPKQRVHRVNGLSQDPSLRFSPGPRSGSETAAALARAVPNPFRRLSTRRTHGFSSIPLQAMHTKSERSRARFDFRVSQASDCAGLCADTADVEGLKSDSDNGTASPDGRAAGSHADVDLRESGSSQSSSGTTHSFPFSLIPLPEAARLQAIKRTQELPELRRPTSRFPSIGTPIPAHRRMQQLSSQRHGIARGSTQTSNMGSSVPDTSWETVTPFDSSRSASQVLKSAATRLRLDNIVYRFEQRQQQQQKQVQRKLCPTPERRSNTPRLYPWDYQQQRISSRQWNGQPTLKKQGTDPELRDIVAHTSVNTDDLERTGVPTDPEAFISEEGRRRRRVWFAYMMAISVLLPFLSVMVHMGRLDCGLSWYTRGEVARLSRRQRRAILATMVLQFVLWPSVLIYVIWQQQQK
ncbi:hypothetical protein CMQ_5547 [Grosmannia clavigera kw1407]|uniref:Uncharacterized protein n=1 Tax=Grosmannia clavigera (strain kw1407 / UAMH 11150) TaxID=655863 RepID=F0XT31_GROCL|nr:uncharacterized protein CMQ_5547 [Grosmannia clavigera kw1407]EFW99126.1 hypothetical protein CMQ_5547 [Grosmannia clavigera kw1407]